MLPTGAWFCFSHSFSLLPYRPSFLPLFGKGGSFSTPFCPPGSLSPLFSTFVSIPHHIRQNEGLHRSCFGRSCAFPYGKSRRRSYCDQGASDCADLPRDDHCDILTVLRLLGLQILLSNEWNSVLHPRHCLSTGLPWKCKTSWHFLSRIPLTSHFRALPLDHLVVATVTLTPSPTLPLARETFPTSNS